VSGLRHSRGIDYGPFTRIQIRDQRSDELVLLRWLDRAGGIRYIRHLLDWILELVLLGYAAAEADELEDEAEDLASSPISMR
jgi:hypothetical protein